MDEELYVDLFGNEIVLVLTVYEEILIKHPESALFWDRVARLLNDPDEIRKSKRDPRSVVYYRYEEDVLRGKWIVAVIKRIDRHFV